MSRRAEVELFEYEGYSLTRRSDSERLYIKWYDARAKRTYRKSTGVGDVEDAKERLIVFAQAEKRRRAPRYIPEPHEVPIWDVLGYYLENHVKAKGCSIGQVRVAYKFFDLFFQEYDINYVSDLYWDVMEEYPSFRNEASRKIKTKRWKSYQKYRNVPLETIELLIADLSPSTYQRDLGVLTAALNVCRDRQRITDVPRIPKPNHLGVRERWLTPDEFKMLYEAADTQRLRDYMTLAIYTLQRPGFCMKLHRAQVDIGSRLIHPYKPGERRTNKGRKPIRIAESAIGPIQRMMERSESGFLIEYEGQPIKTDLRKSLVNAATEAGLHDKATPLLERVVPYTLRHTGATWLAQQGVDLWEIAGMLGHKSIKMVERVYAKHHPDYHKRGTAALDNIVGGAIERASYAPERLHEAIKAEFFVPFKDKMTLGLIDGGPGLTRTADLTLIRESFSLNYNGLAHFEAHSVTPNPLGFSDFTRQFRASHSSEVEGD